MDILRRFIVFFIIVTFIPLNTAYAQEKAQKKVVLFLMDNVNYDDIASFGGENFNFLLKNGALGLMNTNSGGSYTDTNAYAAIGAGCPAVSSTHGNLSGGYNDVISGEPVNEIYRRNTGNKLLNTNIANIDIVGLLQNNQNLNRPVKIGLLGSLLHKEGLKTAVIGNESQNLDEISANAALIAMDGNGIVDMGQVNTRLLTKDAESPFGIRTDYNALYKAFFNVKDKADFIVVQPGDLYRLNKYSGLSEEMYLKVKRVIFLRMDDFLGKILSATDKDTLFLMVTPFPSYKDAVAGKKLTPVIAYGDSVPGNILTSPTTKRDGIITNTDIASEVLNYFGISGDSSMTGHAFVYKNIKDPLSYINRLNAITVFNYKSRPAIMKTFIGFILASLILTIISMVHLKKYLIYIKRLLTIIMIAPTHFLIVPIFNPWSGFKLFVGILFLVVISLIILSRFSNNNLIFAVFLLGSTALIILDTFLGNPLAKVSIFGYDPIGGARFYGIGNEYMGFLLGSTIVGTAALIDKFNRHGKSIKFLSILIYTLALFTLAHPSLGTNVGGAMAALVGFCASIILLFKEKISPADFVKIGLFLLIFLVFLFIYDGMRPQNVQSHIGQTSTLIRQNNVLSFLLIFKRKLLMNYKLIKYSNWTLVLIAIMAALGILFSWPVGILKQIFRHHKYLYFGFVSGIIGTAAAFMFNDSGVVAAAISMIPIGISLILLCIDEIKEGK